MKGKSLVQCYNIIMVIELVLFLCPALLIWPQLKPTRIIIIATEIKVPNTVMKYQLKKRSSMLVEASE